MTTKDRLGSDPLSFIKDTKAEAAEDKGEEPEKVEQKEAPKEAAASADKAGSKSKKNAKSPKEGVVEETVEVENLNMQIKKMDSDHVSMLLEGEMSIYNSKEVMNYLAKGFKDYNEIDMDLSKINKMDTAGFQLILAAKKEAEESGKMFKLLNPGNEVVKVFELYGESL